MTALTEQRVTAIFLFDRDYHREIEDLVAYRLRKRSNKGLRKTVLTVFAMFREDIMNLIHFFGRKEFSFFAFMTGLATLFTFALWLVCDLFDTGWIGRGRARRV